MTKEEVLRQYFGYTEFRPGQAAIVDALLAGRDALCIMPTGAGKSICYEVPALLLPGVTLVISPLISLMQDQVQALVQAGVPAAYLNSTLSAPQHARVLQNMREGKYKLLYVAPERLSTEAFLAACDAVELSLVAVDEAHCVSQWGQDFRPDYSKIADFIAARRTRPTVGAFTATATRTVREDIAQLLALESPEVAVMGFDRPNLYFGVEQPQSKTKALLKLLEPRRERCGIVYCATRANVETVTELLQAHGFSAKRYHAGLDDEERRRNQEDFVYDRCSIMVATNAFGMGIDKSNVAFVIHYNMPKNLESYYQEAGRAGRDGSPADCILLYSPQDVHTARFLIEHSDDNEALSPEEQAALKAREYDRLKHMTFYCITGDCLRAYILKYFGEHAEPSCGNCSSCAGGMETVDKTVEAQQALSCVVRCGQRFGAAVISGVLRGADTERIRSLGFQKLSTYGLMRGQSEADVRRLLDGLLARGLLVQTADEYPVLRLAPAARAVLSGEEKFMLRVPVTHERPERAARTPRGKSARSAALDAADIPLFNALKKRRAAIAAKASVPAYVIFTDATLRDMCQKRPKTHEALLEVSGVGDRKAARYGEIFLKEIEAFEATGPEE